MVKPIVEPDRASDRFEAVVRVFFGAVLGSFIGLVISLRLERPPVADPAVWLVGAAAGLLLGVIVAWRGRKIRRVLQRWLWWFP
jgi:cell division protein FtsW (lipid II flippase)